MLKLIKENIEENMEYKGTNTKDLKNYFKGQKDLYNLMFEFYCDNTFDEIDKDLEDFYNLEIE